MFCKGCGKCIGPDSTMKFCSEECEEKYRKHKWNLKNNFGIPSGDVKYITKGMLGNYRTWANERKLEFNITMDDIIVKFLKQEGKCALSGEELYFVPIKNASLDRIDSNIGYEVDNIQWVLKDINKMKNNLPEDRFVELCMKVNDYKKE